MHKYTKDQLAFLRHFVVGRTKNRLTKMFNNYFQLNLTVSQIKSCCMNHKFPASGLDTKFKKGDIPSNKGKKGVATGGKETQFKKGHKPYNYKPVGTERVNGDGYVDIKIADPNVWKAKHRIVWEKENGTIPDGCVLIFGDGNRFNFEIENLLLVSRKQLAIMNNRNLLKNKNLEMTKTGIIIADLISKISEHKQKK